MLSGRLAETVSNGGVVFDFWFNSRLEADEVGNQRIRKTVNRRAQEGNKMPRIEESRKNCSFSGVDHVCFLAQGMMIDMTE